MLAKNKLNSIESLISQALIDMEISHEEFTTILKEKDKYEKMEENVRNVSEIWDWIAWIQEGHNNFRQQEIKMTNKIPRKKII